MRNTDYAEEIHSVENDAGHRIERLHVKEQGRDQIRFSWWKDGNFVPRPLCLTEDELMPLMRDAMAKGVFTPVFLENLRAAIADHLGGGGR